MVQKLFIHEEQKSERYANYARLLFTLLYIIGGLSIKEEIPSHSFNTLIVLSSINFLYGCIVFLISRRNHYIPWLKYLSVTLDIVILSLFIYNIGTYRTFKTEAFALYYLWIALATIRFSPRLTLLAGLLSITLYTLIIILSSSFETIEFGSITQSFTTPMVSINSLTAKVIILTVFVAIAVYISSVFRELVTKTVNEMIITQENETLSNKLENATKISEIDPLTQLYNRRKIGQMLDEVFSEATLSHQKPALIMVDIDHFKPVNDHFGHLEGDKVLVQITQRMQHSLRKEDVLGRWGGEEFLIILPSTDIDTALFLGERLRKHVVLQLPISSENVTCSFGVTLLQDDDTVESFIRRADKALYLSKENGRNRVTHL